MLRACVRACASPLITPGCRVQGATWLASEYVLYIVLVNGVRSLARSLIRPFVSFRSMRKCWGVCPSRQLQQLDSTVQLLRVAQWKTKKNKKKKNNNNKPTHPKRIVVLGQIISLDFVLCVCFFGSVVGLERNQRRKCGLFVSSSTPIPFQAFSFVGRQG